MTQTKQKEIPWDNVPNSLEWKCNCCQRLNTSRIQTQTYRYCTFCNAKEIVIIVPHIHPASYYTEGQ